MAVLTCQDVMDGVRELVDDNNGDLVTDAKLIAHINRSGARWHKLLVACDPNPFIKVDVMTPSTGAFSFALPADHYKSLGVVRLRNIINYEYSLDRMEYRQYQESIDQTSTGDATAYMLLGTFVTLWPHPPAGTDVTYAHHYIHGWVQLATGTDKIEGWTTNTYFDHYVDWLLYDVALRLKLKEETAVAALRDERDKIQLEMQQAAQDREMGSSRHIQDKLPDYQVERTEDDFWRHR